MNGSLSKLKKIQAEAQAALDEKRLGDEEDKLTGFQKTVHFCALVGRSFVANRCLVRASALAYTTLLALIPLLAVATIFFKGESGHKQIEQWVGVGIDKFAPQLGLVPQSGGGGDAHKLVMQFINDSIANVSVGTLGTTAFIALLFVGISLLSNIETALNDIWGVRRGRSWLNRGVFYWTAISLGPLLLTTALGFNVSSHLELVRKVVGAAVVGLLGHVVPVILVIVAFALFYMLMPNTRVSWRAALVGGMVGGVLFHLNNAFSSVYLGQVVRNSKIYGSLAVIPIFLIGMYFSWSILLFGAQVSYAFQNRRAYLQEKLAESLNQRDRELVAVRLLGFLGQRFARRQGPPTIRELAEAVGVPTRLAQKILEPLLQSSLILEVAGLEPAYAPGRPLNQITFKDILEAMRSQGPPLATREDEASAQVQAELKRIQQAESGAAEAVTLEKLAL